MNLRLVRRYKGDHSRGSEIVHSFIHSFMPEDLKSPSTLPSPYDRLCFARIL